VNPRAARLSGTRLWTGTALLAAATLAGVGSLGVLLAPGSWMAQSAAVVLLLAVSTAALRALLHSTFVPTGWAALIGVLAVTAAFGGIGRGWAIPQPTGQTLDRLRVLVGSGVQAITDGSIPVGTTRGLDLLVVTGAVTCYLLADLLVLGMGRAGLGGVAIAGLWLPVVVLERRPALPLLAVGGITFILLLALTHRRQLHRSGGEEAAMVTAIAAGVTTLALVFASAAAALPFYGSVRIPSSWGGQNLSDSPLRVSTDLDMRADLSQRSDRPLLRYTTEGPTPGPFRMYTMSLFDGQEWQRSEAQPRLRSSSGRLWPRGEAEGTTGEPSEIQVTVIALNQDHLPIPTDPRRVEADGTWLYDEQRDEVVGANTSTRGLTFDLVVEPRTMTVQSLRGDRVGRPPGVEDYLQVPESDFTDQIRGVAEEVTADAATDYDRVLALQSYFRDLQAFTYETQLPPPRTDDAVWDFLTDRRGYCVQFATAMTIMARTIGVPARMAVGFLPGQRDPDLPRTWEVSARRAHTWPEIYFEDTGWVRFEPTPAAQTGAPPIYADPFFGIAGPLPEDVPTGTGQTVAPGEEGSSADGGAGYLMIAGARIPTLVVVLVAVVLALSSGSVVAWWLRRRRLPGEPRGPDEWWARLREVLGGYGVVWSDATTPRQAARIVREGYPRGADVDDPSAALDALVAAVENERYAPRMDPWSTEELRGWVTEAERPLAEHMTAVTEARATTR
jgi:hypothetical protein